MEEVPPRKIVVGDLHGCLPELKALLLKVGFRPGTDELWTVGDLIDRGPDSVGIIRLLTALEAKGVHGNHDEYLVKWAKEELALKGQKDAVRKIKLKEGQYKVAKQLGWPEVRWLAALPLIAYPAPNVVVVHAGLDARKGMDAQGEEVLRLMYVDDRSLEPVSGGHFSQPSNTMQWASASKHEVTVIHGHHTLSTTTPILKQNKAGKWTVNIDTGCCYGGFLTGIILPSWEIVQVRAQREYAYLTRQLPVYEPGSKKKGRVPPKELASGSGDPGWDAYMQKKYGKLYTDLEDEEQGMDDRIFDPDDDGRAHKRRRLF